MTLKTAFNCTQQGGTVSPALGKSPWMFLSFFFLKKQKIEHQSEANSAKSWTPKA
jgi:hypothetical protein